MSRQAEAREQQGYVDKFVPNTCSNCANFTCEMVDVNKQYEGRYPPHFEAKNMRCGRGDFSVKKMASCDYWSRKKEQTE